MKRVEKAELATKLAEARAPIVIVISAVCAVPPPATEFGVTITVYVYVPAIRSLADCESWNAYHLATTYALLAPDFAETVVRESEEVFRIPAWAVPAGQ